jgi:RNA polymerase sigma-70 factor (ECF subfamily)
MQTSSPETRDSLLQRLPNAEDTEAWEQFVALYGNVLYRVARRQGLQLADADNLVQEVMLAVSQSISQWLGREDRGRFRAWLKRIARNEAVDLLTRRTKRSLSGEEMADELLSKLPARDVLCSQLDLEYERAAFSGPRNRSSIQWRTRPGLHSS